MIKFNKYDIDIRNNIGGIVGQIAIYAKNEKEAFKKARESLSFEIIDIIKINH